MKVKSISHFRITKNATFLGGLIKGDIMEKHLDSFDIGERGTVKIVLGEGRVKRRLFDMGITPGVEIMLRKKAPLGDPIEITLRGYELTLRKAEANFVVMEEKR